MNESILRRLSGEPKPRKFATIDIEARHWVEPYAVGFFDGADYKDFVDYEFKQGAIDGALEYVLTDRFAGYWIYAHNGGNYDFTFFLHRLIVVPSFSRKFHVEITPIGSTIVCFEVLLREPNQHTAACLRKDCKGCAPKRTTEGKNQKWTFVDSARLMPLPLRKVGETFLIGKKVELEMSYDELAKPANEPTMRHYMKVDCTLLHAAIGKMQDTVANLGGQLGITLPSTALDLFRRRYLKEDIYTNRHYLKCPEYGKQRKRGETFECRGCLHEFIREAYFGGRSEIFRMQFPRGGYTEPGGRLVDRAYMFDINSHYPHCMLEPMPVGPAVEIEGLTEEQVYVNAKRMTGIVECDVFIPADCYLPPLPVRHEGKLMFPTGHLRGTWDTSELLLLPKVGGKILVTRKSVWFENSPVFARFIRQMYKFRDKNDPHWNAGMDWIAKIFMNASYGKFAMKEDRSKILIRPDSPEGLRCINFDADVWAEKTVVSPAYIVPQLSVHVTSLARARLWEILFRIVSNGGRVYYTDTDSVVCSGFQLPVGRELGQLKLEATVVRAEFALPKLYLIETEELNKDKTEEAQLKVKAKGLGPGIKVTAETAKHFGLDIKKENIEDGDDPYAGQLSEKDFFDLVRRGVPIERHRISKLREALKAFAKKATAFPSIIPASKQMQSNYDKRLILDDYNTVPISLQHF